MSVLKVKSLGTFGMYLLCHTHTYPGYCHPERILLEYHYLSFEAFRI